MRRFDGIVHRIYSFVVKKAHRAPEAALAESSQGRAERVHLPLTDCSANNLATGGR